MDDRLPGVRLNKYIADSGYCSRREADRLSCGFGESVQRIAFFVHISKPLSEIALAGSSGIIPTAITIPIQRTISPFLRTCRKFPQNQKRYDSLACGGGIIPFCAVIVSGHFPKISLCSSSGVCPV